MEKDTKFRKDDAKTNQDEEDVLMEVPTAASDRKLEVVIDVKKEYSVSITMGEAPSKPSFIFPFSVEKSNPYSSISYANYLLVASSDGMKGLDSSINQYDLHHA